jgi:hypothetical protein
MNAAGSHDQAAVAVDQGLDDEVPHGPFRPPLEARDRFLRFADAVVQRVRLVQVLRAHRDGLGRFQLGDQVLVGLHHGSLIGRLGLPDRPLVLLDGRLGRR